MGESMPTEKRKTSTRVSVIFPDIHLQDRSENGIAPMDRHDPAALSVALQIAEDVKPDEAVQLGDLLHLSYISGFQRKKDQLGKAPSEDGETINLTVAKDMVLGNIFWDYLQKATKGADSYYQLEGNHEEIMRVARNMNTYAPYVSSDWYVDKALHLKERGIKWIPYQRYDGSKNWVDLGKVKVIHGQYTSANHLTKHHEIYDNVIYGHLHSYSATSFKNLYTVSGAWCIGCLCSPNASYMRGRVSGWTEGVTVVYHQPNGRFSVFFIPIIDGSAIWNGKTYTAKRLPGLM